MNTAPTLQSVEVVHIPDPDPDLSYLSDSTRYQGVPAGERARYVTEDAERLASYGDSWACIGVRVRAEVVVCGVVQRVESAGLWGVEDDSAPDYLDSVARDECAELAPVLSAMNVRTEDGEEITADALARLAGVAEEALA